MSTASEIVPLHASVQNYAWGMLPTDGSLAARLHALNSHKPVDDTKPYAELWMGVHPSGPTVIANGVEGEEKTLQKMLEDAGLNKLPYLFKVLSVAKPLSIQAHPHKALAEQLHASNPKAYKDDNHKPEMCVALSDFEGMCNFRPLSEIHDHLQRYVDFANLCGGKPIIQALAAASSTSESDPAQSKQVLKQLFSSLMNNDANVIELALQSTLALVTTKVADLKSDADKLFERLHHYYPGDVGCFAAFLLNFIRIGPGDAFFMAANEPHAYLKGQCMEIMANSDNVVRAGLTPKFKDTNTLINMLTYNEGPPVVMKGDATDRYTTVYQPPAEEFQLSKIVLPPAAKHTLPPANDSGLILCITGNGWIRRQTGSTEKLPVQAGSLYYIPKESIIEVSADASPVESQPSQDLVLYRAGVNERVQ